VTLSHVEVDSGEKDEKEIWKSRSRLYRYAADKNPQEWVTRGIGHVRFLKHIKNGQTRIVLREGKTLKVRMNHMVQPDATLKPKAGAEEVCYQWYAKDYAEDDPWEGLFAIKLPTQEVALEFKKQYETAQKANKLAAPGNENASGDASSSSSRTTTKQIIRPGDNKTFPKFMSQFTANVHAYLANDKLKEAFWSTYESKPYSSMLGRSKMIPFWNQAILGMSLGEKAIFHVISDEGYGKMGNDDFKIPPNADLIFEIELLSIKGGTSESEAAPITAAPNKATSPPAPKATKGTSAPTKDNKDSKTKENKKTQTTTSDKQTTNTGNTKANLLSTPTTSSSTSTGAPMATPTYSSGTDEKKESPWRKLNKVFRSHVEKDIAAPSTVGSDWSTAMSEYLIFAHKLRSDKTQVPTRVLARKGNNFENLNKAFHKWMLTQKEAAMDADWSPPIRDYLDHIKKLAK